jgi:hypothetical protein
MNYRLNTPWRWETWGIHENRYSPYARLASRSIVGGTISGTINPFLTDIPRAYSLLVNGTTVTEVQTPYQDDLASADAAYLGGHEYILTQAEAQILIDAGYSDYLTPIGE